MNPTLYVVLDRTAARGRELDSLLAAVIDGGCRMVQLREKEWPSGRLLPLARRLRDRCRSAGVTFIINDRVDVAVAVEADGVHVGQDDIEPEDARRLLGPGPIIGLSVKTVAQAQAVPVGVVDYVCIGGVFATASKHNPEPPVGIDGLKSILTVIRRRAPRLPIGAIAGIDATNAAAVMAAGVDGIAVISALSLAADVSGAARTLRGIVDAGLRTGR